MSEEDESVGTLERVLHYITIIIAICLIFAAARAVLVAVTIPPQPPLLNDEKVGGQKGKVKPLPDYMIDNIKPDELNELKQ